MARPPVERPAGPADDPFIREVDEAYRRDEVERFVRSWGRYILLALGAGLAAFGGYLYWRAQQQKAAEGATEALVAALAEVEKGNSAAADAPLAEVAASGTAAQRALARLTQGGLAAARGDPAAALTAFRSVADDPAAPLPLRDLARVRALRQEFDRLSPDEVLARARPFLEGDSPWFAAVAEMAAVAHLKAGREKEAGSLFLRLAGSTDAPESQRARAEQMAASLGEDTAALAERMRAGREPMARPGGP
ncbi:tetratricopeptide repeat protein [Thermaurantiacus sp.]